MMTDMTLVPAAVRLLIQPARDNRLLLYSELAHLGGVEPHALDKMVLGHIRDDICEQCGYPPLTAVVVNKRDFKPGPGFWDIWPELVTDDQRDASWIKMVKDVFEYNWDDLYAQYGGKAVLRRRS